MRVRYSIEVIVADPRIILTYIHTFSMPLAAFKDGVVHGVKKLVGKATRSDSSTSSPSTVPSELENATLVNTPKYTLETFGKRVPVRVIDVYDGDTLVVAMEVSKRISSFRVRLAHVDTPELKPALNVPDRDAIILQAKASRDYLASIVLGHIVWMDILGFEKYGRLLADVYTSEREAGSVNEKIIADGYGVVYEGGTKQ